MNTSLRYRLEQLRASRFSGLGGARLSASIPIATQLLNDIVTGSLPAAAPVRDLTVEPKAGNRLRVTAKLAKAAFLPPLSLTFEIERQAIWPDSPLVLRVQSLPGLVALAGAVSSLAAVLPPGIRLEDQRVYVDLRAILERQGWGEIVPYVDAVEIGTEEGRLLVNVRLAVRDS